MTLINKSVLVTGGGGFIGSHLCEALVQEGAEVRVIDNVSSGRISNLENIKNRITFYKGNINDEKNTEKACKGIDVVIHTAFPMELREHSIDTKPVTDFMAGISNLLKETLKNNSLFIYISSIAVYGNQKYLPIDENHPLDPVMLHGALKLAGEYMCRTMCNSHGLKTIILRTADIYGPKNTRISVPIRFLINALNQQSINIFGTGQQTRTYTYIDDFTKSVLTTIKTPAAVGKILNISSSQSISLYELALLAKQITGSSSEIIIDKNIPADNRQLVINNTLAQNILKIHNYTNMKEGLTKTRDWLVKNFDFYKKH